MNVFMKRPLSLILCIMLGGFSVFVDLDLTARIVAVALALCLFASCFIFKDLFGGRSLLVALVSLAFAISIILSHLFVMLYFPTEVIGTEATVTGKVKDKSHDSSYDVTLSLRSDTVNGERGSHIFIIRADHDTFSAVGTGDIITVKATVTDLRDPDSAFDTHSYYVSLGYSAQLTDISSVELIESSDSFTRGFLIDTRSYISAKFKLATDSHTGGFLAALIMGDKSGLDPNTELNYSLLGITHILALSGMHLVILSEAVRIILSKLRLNKKIILVVSTAFCLFYMAITGFSASVVRSAAMLTVTNGMFLLAGTHDSYTTLPLSVVLILAFQPYAVYDVSLWLSAFATLGVLVFAELDANRAPKQRGWLATFGMWIWQSVFATILAIGASYLIMLKLCRVMSVFAPIATFIFSLPINFLIFAGIALLLFEPIIPLGQPIILITDTINEAAEALASVQWAAYSIHFTPVRVLIIAFAVLLFAFIVFKVRHMRAAIALLVALFFAAPALGVGLTQHERHTDAFTYTSESSADVMTMKCDGEITLIYSGSHTMWAAAGEVYDIYENNYTSIDNLVLTNYKNGTPAAVRALIGAVKTDVLYVPEPRTVDELSIAEAIAELLSSYGTDLAFYKLEEPLIFGDYRYHLILNEPYDVGDATDYAYTLSHKGEYYTYFSRGATSANPLLCRRIGYSTDHLIFGTHGGESSSAGSFALASENVKSVYYRTSLPLSDASVEYYKQKEVPITMIDTQIDLKR